MQVVSAVNRLTTSEELIVLHIVWTPVRGHIYNKSYLVTSAMETIGQLFNVKKQTWISVIRM